MSGAGAEREPAIVATGLVKRYGDREALAGVDLRIEPGEVFGLLGPNGAGKTTLVETVAGLRSPTAGTVRVAGLDPAREREAVTRLLAVQPQAAALFPTLTARETLELFASFYDDPLPVDEALALVALESGSTTRVRALSGGQARRLLIAVALIGRPGIAILDEPSAGLDPAARRELWGVVSDLRGRGVTVLLTTHHLDEAAELCDRIAILTEGRIVALDSPDRLIAEETAAAEVRFSIASDAGARELLVAALAGGDGSLITGFLEIAERQGRLAVRVRSEDPDALLRALTFTRGLRASGFSVHRATLEDVYLRLTGTAASS